MLRCILKNKKIILIFVIIFIICCVFLTPTIYSSLNKEIIPTEYEKKEIVYQSKRGLQDQLKIIKYEYSKEFSKINHSSKYSSIENELNMIKEKILRFKETIEDEEYSASFIDNIMQRISDKDLYYYKDLNEVEFELYIYLKDERVLYFFDYS